ncbi:MAG: LysR substrate-binding domain-containing protein [Stenotrophomonas geniculata]
MVTQRQLPSLAAIRAFEAAARLGSFARAAEELDTSAASVSYHVRRLEAQTGTCLFLRHAQHVELTATGASVAQEATRAFDALRASFMRAADMDAARLRLSVLPTLGTSWLTPRLGTFRARHRQFVLELDLSAAPQDLAAGHFDAAIRNGQGEWPGLQATPLFPSVFTPLCAPALLPAARGLGSSALEIPLLGRPDWWALWFAAHGTFHRRHRRVSSRPLPSSIWMSAPRSQGRASPLVRRSCSRPSWTAGVWCRRIRGWPATVAASGSWHPRREVAVPRSLHSVTGWSSRPPRRGMQPAITWPGR